MLSIEHYSTWLSVPYQHDSLVRPAGGMIIIFQRFSRSKTDVLKSSANRSKGTGIFLNTPIPLGGAINPFTYLDFLAFFLSLAGFSAFCFSGMHPQPQSFFFSAILITSFLLKQLSKHLIMRAKKLPTSLWTSTLLLFAVLY